MYWNAAQRFPGSSRSATRSTSLPARAGTPGEAGEPPAHHPRPEEDLMIPVPVPRPPRGPCVPGRRADRGGSTLVGPAASDRPGGAVRCGSRRTGRGGARAPRTPDSCVVPGRSPPGGLAVVVRLAEPLESLVVLLTDMKSRRFPGRAFSAWRQGRGRRLSRRSRGSSPRRAVGSSPQASPPPPLQVAYIVKSRQESATGPAFCAPLSRCPRRPSRQRPST